MLKKTILIIGLVFINLGFSQGVPNSETRPRKDSVEYKEYPYVFPVWGQKLTNKGIKFPLPIGISANYVYSEMDLEITRFTLSIGDVDLSSIVNEENLNFTSVSAGVNAINIRPDFYVLPFLNIYGLYSYGVGFTQVALAPIFGDTELPEMTPAPARFTANSFGLGGTLNYGIKGFFFSIDGNISWNYSALLAAPVALVTSSIRVGYTKTFDNDMGFSVYVGAMYRNFTNLDPVSGSSPMAEIFPELESEWNTWYDGLSNVQKKAVDKVTEATQDAVGSSIFESTVNYEIKKQLISPWTFQFGGQYQITPHWAIRAEFGLSKYQTSIFTGVNFRFGIPGIKKKRNKEDDKS
jgi:hypothetical protein